MSLPDKDRRERDAQALGDLIRGAAEASESARRTSMPARRRDVAARQKLVDSVRTESPRRRAWVAGFACAAVLACAAFFFLRNPKLGYAVDGGDVGYVRAEAHRTVVRFDEGSTFTFASGSSGRVGEVTADGASVVLEDGSLEASVVHRVGAKWSALAGPWEVSVTGTRFDVAWDPRQRALRVDLVEGKVVVRGPGAEDGISLHAGQTLRARDGEGIHVASLERAAAASPSALSSPGGGAGGGAESAPQASGAQASAAQPSAAQVSAAQPLGVQAAPSVAEPSTSEPGAAPSPSLTALGDKPRISWTELVAKGKHDQVLSEVRERGAAGVLSSASASDLVALADAARYGGDGGLASSALKSLRDRFSGTKAATDAAFLLGRMADDGGSPAGAIRFYDAHIAEGGAFAAEALGRKMIAVRKSSGDAAGRAVAKQYLDRYPRGAHASVARGLIDGDVGFGGDLGKGASPR